MQCRPLPLFLLLCATWGCSSSPPPAPADPQPPTGAVAEKPAAEPDYPDFKRCDEREALFDGGDFLRTEDGVALWYKVAGPATAPTVVHVHGGPCFGGHDFEKTAGRLLERSLRMVYLEQRGCSRSTSGATDANLTMDATIEDFERLRRHLGVDRLDLVAHSAGGWVALEYLRRHPDRIGRVVMVDTSGVVEPALQHQLDFAAEIAPTAFPREQARVREIAAGTGPANDRLGEMHALLGDRFFRAVFYGSEREANGLGRWSSALRKHCFSHPMSKWYRRSGYLDRAHPELMTRLPVPALLIAGRKSQAFGAAILEQAAAAWGAELRWIEGAGHFVYIAEPEAFARQVIDFLVRPGGPSPR